MPSLLARPPYDRELKTSLDAMGLKPDTHVTPSDIPALREEHTPNIPLIQSLLVKYSIEHEERTIAGPGGDLTLSIFRSKTVLSPSEGLPGIYFTHGGGMISGSRFMGIELAFDWVKDAGAICVSVEYRLAPEHPDPAPIEDCYAGLVWMTKNAASLGINPKKVLTAGISAGGGLATGLALLSRDRGGPALCAQLLICPMLDDRAETLSSKQYVDEGVWSRGSNLTGWSSLLGDRHGTDQVSVYAAPARATDLSGLPPTFIDVGEAEVFRDECVAYASHLWACGVQAELHVWPGAWHAFDLFAPTAKLSLIARKTRSAWLQRTLATL